MAVPSIYKITPFDAAVGTVVRFSWSGMAQKANTLTIETNDAQHTVVYQSTQSSYNGTHTIPANSGLVNGTAYRARITVTDMSDTVSDPSPYALFYCFTTPVFRFRNISSGDSIPGSEVQFEMEYSQTEGELLNSWMAYLYTQTRTQLDSSPQLYAANTLVYRFSGLVDQTTYYIRATGTTVNGMPVDTGYVEIHVQYSHPANFRNISVENDEPNGRIHVQSFMVAITGVPEHDVTYVYDDDDNPYAADLRDNSVIFNTLNDLNDDLTLYIKGNAFEGNADIAEIDENDDSDVFNVEYQEITTNTTTDELTTTGIRDDATDVVYTMGVDNVGFFLDDSEPIEEATYYLLDETTDAVFKLGVVNGNLYIEDAVSDNPVRKLLFRKGTGSDSVIYKLAVDNRRLYYSPAYLYRVRVYLNATTLAVSNTLVDVLPKEPVAIMVQRTDGNYAAKMLRV